MTLREHRGSAPTEVAGRGARFRPACKTDACVRGTSRTKLSAHSGWRRGRIRNNCQRAGPEDVAVRRGALAKDAFVKVSERCERAASARLKDDEWERLTADVSSSVRHIIAARYDTPAWVLEHLATDPDRHTRQAVVDNLEPELVSALQADPDWTVRGAARRLPDQRRSAGGPHRGHRRPRAWCGGGEQRTRDFLLATERSADVRWSLCSTHSKDKRLIRALRDDPDDMVADQAREALNLRRRWDDLVGRKFEDRQVTRLLPHPEDDSPQPSPGPRQPGNRHHRPARTS
jgi:hypothetical protein